jgi:uncharacterized protein (DUF1697 family)
MPRFVALFRGINVGKAKRIAMADLRRLLKSLGYERVRTLLNSGNVVFDAPTRSARGHADRIRAAVADELGVDAMVVVKSAQEIDAIVADNRLATDGRDASKLLVAFTADARTLAGLAKLAGKAGQGEEFQMGRHAAYLWCANGILQSRLAVALLELEGVGTTRNWATTLKIKLLLNP